MSESLVLALRIVATVLAAVPIGYVGLIAGQASLRRNDIPTVIGIVGLTVILDCAIWIR